MIDKKRIFKIGYLFIPLLWGILFFETSLNGQIYTGQTPVSISIPEVAVVDIEPNNTRVSLNLEVPTEGGKSLVVNSKDNTKWINYTCALAPNASARNIYMEASNNSLPEGINLELTIGAAVGGAGNLGTAVGKVSLTNQPQLIISGIGRSYTGNGVNNGHQLTYNLSIADYSKLEASQSTAIQVLITISE